ncbi:MAG TPA: PrsW family intramembrane metalloprotease [Actinophytocola sp.]|jgi:RsiW-degrading membrane proteinase PrsW (M82 family)|nr:PrsW family intramembrane metalloprotease [Actinophytocola sp.]
MPPRHALRHRPRRRTVLAPVAGLVALAGCGLALLALSTARVGLLAELVGIVAALVPVGTIVAALLWIDRWEPEPARLLWLAFGWGASVAAITALLINNTAEAVGDALLGHGKGDTISAVVSAPLFEEAAKGAFVLGILLWLRNELDGVIDGVVYAGFVAAGFAFTENIYYFGRAFAEHGFGDTSTAGVVTAFILRGVLAPFCHPLFTAMIGIGVGISVRTPNRSLKILAPAGGYLAAVTLHAMWNAAATLGTAQTFLNVYFLVMVPIFIAGVLFVGWHRRREQKIVARALPVMIGRGWVDERDTERLTNLTARRAWRARTARRKSKAAARDLGAYQAAVTELAFLWHAARLGLAGADAAERETRLVAALETTRHHAQRQR